MATRVESWQVRDLASNVFRIELSGLPRHPKRGLHRSMARAVAYVHGVPGKPLPAAREAAQDLDAGDFVEMVRTMRRSTHDDFKTWRA